MAEASVLAFEFGHDESSFWVAQYKVGKSFAV
jgi:hypothetical protein